MCTHRFALALDGVESLNDAERARLSGGDGGGSYQPPAAPEDQPATIGASLLAGLVNR
jgi:hypothetical protein